MFNHRLNQEDEISVEELSEVTAERGRDFIPRIDLGPGIFGAGPAVGLYDALVAQGWTPIQAIEEVCRTLIPTRIERESCG